MGIREFVLEGDFGTIVQALNGSSHAPSLVAPLIYGILAECNELRNVTFSHVRQQCNRPPHLLAKHALGVIDYSAWIGECHWFLEQALIHDVHYL